jgi:MurNAc alpha-1-phosphate uridylyltransferase
MLPLFKQAMLAEQISAEKLQGIWVDVGTPERLAELDRQIYAGELA